MSSPPTRRTGPKAGSRILAAKQDRNDRSTGDCQFALTEARRRAEKIAVVVAADLLDHGTIDGDTGAWLLAEIDRVGWWIDRARCAA